MTDKVRINTSLEWSTLRIIDGVQKKYGMTRNSAIGFIVKDWDEICKNQSGTGLNPKRRA